MSGLSPRCGGLRSRFSRRRTTKAFSGLHAGQDGPHEGIAIFGALFATWPPIYESIICGRRGSDCIQISRDRFSKAGKTILDPSMRTVHSPPELNQWPPIPACNYRGSRRPLHRQSLRSLPLIKRKRRRGRTSRATGSAHLPVYQAGGPPLDFEKTRLSLLGLRGSVGSIGHVCADENWRGVVNERVIR